MKKTINMNKNQINKGFFMINIKRIGLIFMLAVLIMVSCKKNSETDFSDNDIDTTNFSDTEAEHDDSDSYDDYVSKFCESIEVVSGGDKNCPVSTDPDGSYEFGLYSQNREGNAIDAVLTIEKVITYDLRPEKDHFGVAIQGLCKGIGFKNGEGACEVYINRSIISMFDTEALIGREWTVYYKLGFYGSIHAEIEGREIVVVRDKSGVLVGVSATGIVDESGEASGDKGVWPTDKVTEFQVKQLVPDECAVSYCKKVDYYDWESIDVLIAPPLKFTRNEKSITVRNYESLEMDDYVYTVRNSLRIHEKDPDQMLWDTGKKYKFEFYVFNKKALK